MYKKIYLRIYSEFFLPSRLNEYREILLLALKLRYEINSVCSFWEKVKAGLNKNLQYLILRHDIDTDVCTAKKFFEIECDLQVKASYYFRLFTTNVSFMQEIERKMGEASYHYEELATFAKERRLKTKEAVHAHMQEIKERFASNLVNLRKKTGLPMKTVASHGDFVNRFLGITNCEILKDIVFRNSLGIDLEVYDSQMMSVVTSRHSDTAYPRFWIPTFPQDALNKRERVVYILTHPRHWQANIRENLKDDFARMVEGCKYYR